MEKRYTFSDRLKELLQIFEIKQTDLSTRTGISKSSISHYIKGDWEGKQDAVYKIAAAFGISEAWLMGIDVPMYATPISSKLTVHEQTMLSAYRAANPALQAKVDQLLNIETRPVLQIENEPRYKVRFAGRDGSIGEKYLTKEEIDALDALPDADDL